MANGLCRLGKGPPWCPVALVLVVLSVMGVFSWPTLRQANASPKVERREPEPKPTIARDAPPRLRFVGDIVLGRYHSDGFRRFSAIPIQASLRERLEGDLVLGNLETPAVSQLPARARSQQGSWFGATADMLTPLAQLGMTHLGLANNHAEDLGEEGLIQTAVQVRSVGIAPIGKAEAKPPYLRFERISLKGTTFEIVAVATLMNCETSNYRHHVPYVPLQALGSTLGPLIRAIPSKHFVIVFVHWGQEDDSTPTMKQREAAHAMVDAGADLVIGHHPHVLQAIELYSDALIAYSLGNFLFDAFVPNRRIGGILGLDFEDKKLCSARISFVPTYIRQSSSFEPELANMAISRQALAAIKLRPTLATQRPGWKSENNRFVSEWRRQTCAAD